MPLAPMSEASSCAAVLSGAGTKGAFEAGALSVLLREGHRFGTVVGTSSGALNGALVAAAARAGAEQSASAALLQTWVDHAGFLDVFSPSAAGIFSRRGFSGEQKLAAALEENTSPWLPGAQHPVRLVVVTTPLHGVPVAPDGRLGGAPATTYEAPLTFADADFDDRARREAVFRAATASAAVPVVFLPVEVPGLGPCSDGGLVNNAPLKYALSDPRVRRVFVVVPYPAVAPEPPLHGLDLIVHCIDIFIEERLLRDLKTAFDVNQQVRALDALAATDAALAARTRQQMGLEGKRLVEIVQIRPPASLAGNDLSGFTDRALRQAQLDAGKAAAEAALQLDPAT
jgi:NTE family protein